MKKVLLAILLSGIGSTVLAAAPDALIKKLETRLGTGQVDSVGKSPYAELYEVRTKTDILYTDKTGKYLISGRVIDVESGTNLTEERLNVINNGLGEAYMDAPGLPSSQLLMTRR